MLIYNDVKKEAAASAILADIMDLAEITEANAASDHTAVTELFLRYAEFESAVTDSLSLTEDGYSGFIRQIRSAGELTGEQYLYSSSGTKYCRNQDLTELLKTISLSREIPNKIVLSVPEGYAFYSLYPEMYIEALKRFAAAYPTGPAVIIGIRSIGCSLASLAAAALKNAGWAARSFTIRPRGDCFDRKVKISADLKREMLRNARAKYLLLDEGPGLSGSSFCSVAEYLSLQGIEDEDIIIFPGWNADGSSFVSEESRARWRRHKKIFVDFEETMIESGRLKRAFGYESITDVSAGRWRRLFYESEKKYPHTFAGAEQRKYIISRSGEMALLKFSGLGRYGKRLFERGRILCQAGFSPEARRFDSGFIEFEFLRGKHLTADQRNQKLDKRVAAYCTYIVKNFHDTPSPSAEMLKEMIKINTEKGLGRAWRGLLEGHDIMNISDPVEKPAAIDGRMLPFEWITTGREKEYVKTDSLQHHSGHFIPGSADIAWDIAGAVVEFRIPFDAVDFLLRNYTNLSRDRHIGKRLPFYILAYTAFRLGYTSFASERAGSRTDYNKLIYQSNYYKRLLRQILAGDILLH